MTTTIIYRCCYVVDDLVLCSEGNRWSANCRLLLLNLPVLCRTQDDKDAVLSLLPPQSRNNRNSSLRLGDVSTDEWTGCVKGPRMRTVDLSNLGSQSGGGLRGGPPRPAARSTLARGGRRVVQLFNTLLSSALTLCLTEVCDSWTVF